MFFERIREDWISLSVLLAGISVMVFGLRGFDWLSFITILLFYTICGTCLIMSDPMSVLGYDNDGFVESMWGKTAAHVWAVFISIILDYIFTAFMHWYYRWDINTAIHSYAFLTFCIVLSRWTAYRRLNKKEETL